jgi:ribosomal protein S24E
MKILKEIKNDLLKRKEIQFVIESEKNPGLEGSKKVLIEKIKSPEENIVVKFVKSKFGTQEFLVEAFVYNSKEDKEKVEPKIKSKKKVGESA